MCDDCKKIMAQIPQRTVNVIEAHRAELIHTFIEMSKAVKPEAFEEALAVDDGEENGLAQQAIALDFAAFIVGFLCGPMNNSQQEHALSVRAFNDGMNVGRAHLGAKKLH